MAKKELRLLENAVGHLLEALAQYNRGQKGTANAYRFSIHHITQFMELAFRYYIILIHPLLIYKNPFCDNLDSDAKTIELDDIVNFLKNEQDISTKFLKDLRWYRQLSISMEYYEFDNDSDYVKETIGRLMHAIIEFDETHKYIDLSEYIVLEELQIFHRMANIYEKRIKKAMEDVEETAKQFLENQNSDNMSSFQVYHCEECHHDTMIPNNESSTGFRCTYCKNEFSKEIESECSVCGISWGIEEMNRYEENGKYIYVCPRCSQLPSTQTA